MHKLKADIWSEITDSLLPAETRDLPLLAGRKEQRMTEEEEEEEGNRDALTFQQLVHDVSETKHQQDASIQYYFICLLHLANEKVRLGSFIPY